MREIYYPLVNLDMLKVLPVLQKQIEWAITVACGWHEMSLEISEQKFFSLNEDKVLNQKTLSSSIPGPSCSKKSHEINRDR